MAKNVLVNLDLNGNQLLNVTAQVLATSPQNPKIGQFYYNSTNKTLNFYTGDTWKVLGVETIDTSGVEAIVNPKLNDVKTELKAYADSIKTALINSASSDYDTLKEIEDIIKRNAGEISAIQGVVKKYTEDIGDNVALEHTIVHNLNTLDVIVGLRTTSSPYEEVIADVKILSNNSVKISTATPIRANEKLRVIIMG